MCVCVGCVEVNIVCSLYTQVLSEDLSQVVTLLSAGNYFGEMGLLFGVPRTATLRAATHCEVNMIPKTELDNVLEVFPIVKK